MPGLGKQKIATSEKVRQLLRRTPRSNEDSIVTTAERVVSLNLPRMELSSGAAIPKTDRIVPKRRTVQRYCPDSQ